MPAEEVVPVEEIVPEEEVVPVEKEEVKVPEKNIVYERDGYVWLFNPKTEIEKKISKGVYPTISPDGTKVSYTYLGESKPVGIYIFDITINKSRLLRYYKIPPRGLRGASWSPDAMYLVVDIGTTPTRFKIVINSTTGEKVTSFITTGLDGYAWISNNEIVFNSVVNVINNIYGPRPWGAGEAYGITVINLDGQKRILKSPTLFKDFIFTKWHNNLIYFSETSIKETGDWLDRDAWIVSYWTMDRFGNNLTQIEIEK